MEQTTKNLGLTLYGNQGWREDGGDAQQLDANMLKVDTCSFTVAAIDDVQPQMSAFSSAKLFTGGKEGMYRITWYACLTQAAAGGSPSSSWLGGVSGFQINYTPAPSTNVTSPASPLSTGEYNTPGTTLGGGIITCFSVANSPITFNFGYSSVGTTPMQFYLHMRVEYLGTV